MREREEELTLLFFFVLSIFVNTDKIGSSARRFLGITHKSVN